MGSADESSSIEREENQELSASELKNIYTSAGGQLTTAADAVRILDVIIENTSSENATNAELLSAISALRNLVIINTREIEYLHRLNGLLIFELTEQGIKIESEELLTELNYIQ